MLGTLQKKVIPEEEEPEPSAGAEDVVMENDSRMKDAEGLDSEEPEDSSPQPTRPRGLQRTSKLEEDKEEESFRSVDLSEIAQIEAANRNTFNKQETGGSESFLTARNTLRDSSQRQRDEIAPTVS